MSADDTERQRGPVVSEVRERGAIKETQGGLSRADMRKQRLADQLRENLKKRKDLTRARKTSDQGGNSSTNPA